MPKNPKKRRCEVEGCQAWARHGESLCASHLNSRVVQERPELILPLLRAVAQGMEPRPLEDLCLIDDELRNLFLARAFFIAWVEKLRAEPPTKPGLGPGQFLRAWNDSTSRLLQLLRARRELGGDKEGEFGDLIRSVYEALEKQG